MYKIFSQETQSANLIHRQEWLPALRAASELLKTYPSVQIALRGRSVGLANDQVLLTLTQDDKDIILKAAGLCTC